MGVSIRHRIWVARVQSYLYMPRDIVILPESYLRHGVLKCGKSIEVPIQTCGGNRLIIKHDFNTY